MESFEETGRTMVKSGFEGHFCRVGHVFRWPSGRYRGIGLVVIHGAVHLYVCAFHYVCYTS